MQKQLKIKAIQALRERVIRDARDEFFNFCALLSPKFYKYEREYLRKLCEIMQDFYQSKDDDVLIVNMPPRHGKSFTASHFAQWVFGINPAEKIMTGSYNETLSTNFSKQVRNSISEQSAQIGKIVYNDIFPNTRIRYGDGAMNLWSLENQHSSYLATSPTGTATGFGASLLIIDDLIKNAEEAFNATTLEKHWDWFVNTMLSRLEPGGKFIIIRTRWHSDDLSGRAMVELERLGFKVKTHIEKAVQEDGTMLCDDVLDADAYKKRTSAMASEIAAANYNQEPIDVKGRLYSSFKTYVELPTFREVRNYTDTADTGDDYLCSIDYGITFQNEAYVLDVLYTKAPMEDTEPAQAAMMHKDDVNIADIESNNGGRGYARQVERHMRQKHQSNKTIFRPFHQSKNKNARILSNATWVMEHIYFPENWRDKWPEYYDAMTRYQREGKNKHDDAPDATTGIAEKIGIGDTFSFA